MRSFSADRIDLVQQICLDLDRSGCVIMNAFIIIKAVAIRTAGRISKPKAISMAVFWLVAAAVTS